MNKFLSGVAAALLALPLAASAASAALPNILWIVAEDINPQLGCYGDTNAVTPNLDQFARGAVRYRNCWSTAPVCAPARTALISGVYPTSTGGEHMRSLVNMPSFMRMYPQFLHDQGYYCANNNKEDYNLEKPRGVWDESSNRAHYRNRKPGQPFFAAFNIAVCHESQIRVRPHTLKHDPALMRVPAYHPDTPEVRRDWAQYYDKITEMDAIAGRLLRELEQAGLADDTIVFFYGDNGSGMPRSKRWPYNSGLRVPLIIRVPEKFKELAPRDYPAGGASDRMVAFVDFAPTLLSLAGIEPPAWMQGHAFMGRHQTEPQRYLHGLRGRMDERIDLVRSVQNGRYVYIRNYMPHRIYGQYIEYMFQTPTTRVWKELYDQGRLKPPQTFFWETKPPEELYDLETDPDEVRNLAQSPRHREILDELRRAQNNQALQVRDLGFLPESERQRRAGQLTPWELGHDPAKYPLERILNVAELASSLRPDALGQLVAGLKDPDSAVRYWSAQGLLMRGAGGVSAARRPLSDLLHDPSPSVRITAAEALGRFGEKEDLELALAALKELAPPARNGVMVSIEALAAIDALGAKAAPIMGALRTMDRKDPKAPGRMGEYVPKALRHILNEKEEDTATASPAQPKRAAKKRLARPDSAATP